MLLKKLVLSTIGFTISTATFAVTPNVVTDIAPVHSLVTQVMEGVAKPTLLVKPEYTPHEYTMRPSEARALSKADAVFWIGEDLTPWLEKSLDTLTPSAVKVSLLEVEGTTLHAFREGATFEAHAHDDHEEHEHEEHHDDEHEHHDDHKEHHHEGNDPHAWLDPVNAQVWVREIALTLATIDPVNASTYQANADKTVVNLQNLITRNQAIVGESDLSNFIVFHDAYQYFEKRFDVSAAGAISISDASDPSPARVSEIRDTVAKLGVSCIFTEPQFNANLVKSVFNGTDVVTMGVMDPLGANLKPGKNQYAELINNLMTSLQQCKP
ncbi:zinc ABC transporter substrate-binding protein [Reinekea marina]|uniref:High-affinity zinc uptake system protein ZnuA n=2 Tax=Reinekea marina TaxID=1310421 RepID=A0ABV7WP26_9GAMM